MTDVDDTDSETPGRLSPHEARPSRVRRGRRRLIPWLLTVGVVVAVVFLIANLLGDAALFFYNADEAVERRVELGDDRFRVQGTPLEDTIIEGFRGDQPVVVFSLVFDEITIDVVHVGDPPELFQPGVPVVLEGSWTEGAPAVDDFDPRADDGWHFASDRMLVRHDNDYRDRDEYDERIDEAEQGGSTEADE